MPACVSSGDVRRRHRRALHAAPVLAAALAGRERERDRLAAGAVRSVGERRRACPTTFVEMTLVFQFMLMLVSL